MAQGDGRSATSGSGVQIIRPDKQAFSTRAAPLLDGFRGDPEIGPLIQRIQAVQ
jgi:hypothetical protein